MFKKFFWKEGRWIKCRTGHSKQNNSDSITGVQEIISQHSPPRTPHDEKHAFWVGSIAVSVLVDILVGCTNTVSDGKIQITILILRRGALSRSPWQIGQLGGSRKGPLSHFGSSWTILVHFGPFWAIFGTHWAIWGHFLPVHQFCPQTDNKFPQSGKQPETKFQSRAPKSGVDFKLHSVLHGGQI